MSRDKHRLCRARQWWGCGWGAAGEGLQGCRWGAAGVLPGDAPHALGPAALAGRSEQPQRDSCPP